MFFPGSGNLCTAPGSVRRLFLSPSPSPALYWIHAPGFGVVLTDQPGKAAWPITGVSYILVHKQPG